MREKSLGYSVIHRGINSKQTTRGCLLQVKMTKTVTDFRRKWKNKTKFTIAKNTYLIYKDESLYVWNLHKFTFLNRSEPNFAHFSPLVWRRSYGLTILQLSHLCDLFCRERVPNRARKVAAGATLPPLLRYIPCWCDVTDVTCTVRNA